MQNETVLNETQIVECICKKKQKKEKRCAKQLSLYTLLSKCTFRMHPHKIIYIMTFRYTKKNKCSLIKIYCRNMCRQFLAVAFLTPQIFVNLRHKATYKCLHKMESTTYHTHLVLPVTCLSTNVCPKVNLAFQSMQA